MESKNETTNAAVKPAIQEQEEQATLTRDQYSLAYDNGYPLTVRFLLSRGLSGESAQEAAQAAWAKGWEHRGNLRNPRKVVSWINTIAFNLFRNWFRRRESPEELPEISIAPRITPQMIDVRRTLAECPPLDRRLIEMHYLEGYTSKELGKKTGCTAVAVRVRLLRARRKLAAELRPEQEAQPENRAAENVRRRHQSHESNELKMAA